MQTEDIFEVRRSRLKTLIEELGGVRGGQRELGERVNKGRANPLSASYISRMLMPPNKKGHKNIGGDMAREIERACDKPPGWMDGAGESAVREPRMTWPLSVSLQDFMALDPRHRREIDEAVTRMVRGIQVENIATTRKKKHA